MFKIWPWSKLAKYEQKLNEERILNHKAAEDLWLQIYKLTTERDELLRKMAKRKKP